MTPLAAYCNDRPSFIVQYHTNYRAINIAQLNYMYNRGPHLLRGTNKIMI